MRKGQHAVACRRFESLQVCWFGDGSVHILAVNQSLSGFAEREKPALGSLIRPDNYQKSEFVGEAPNLSQDKGMLDVAVAGKATAVTSKAQADRSQQPAGKRAVRQRVLRLQCLDQVRPGGKARPAIVRGLRQHRALL